MHANAQKLQPSNSCEASMATATQTTSPRSVTIQPLRPSELANATHLRLNWLWHGYLAPRKVTTLISPSKSGKTTLLAHLLARCGPGGQLAELAVAAGRAIVVYEEPPSDWDARCRQLSIGQYVQYVCRPFHCARPSGAQWLDMD